MSPSDEPSAVSVSRQDALTNFLDIKEFDKVGIGPHWSGTGTGGRGKTVPNAQYLVFRSAPIAPVAITITDLAHLTDRDCLEGVLESCTELQWYHGDDDDVANPPDIWIRVPNNECHPLTLCVDVMSRWWSGMCQRWTLTDADGSVVEQIDTSYDQNPDR
jgi:hypothetical protein